MKYVLLIVLFALTTIPSVQEPTGYELLKTKMETRRQEFQKLFNAADSIKKDSLIRKAREYVFAEITQKMFPHWYGTPWDYNGTTVVPGEGTIACGYFVTTVLRDAGLRIPRVKLAQCASEPMIKKFTKDIKRFHNRDIDDVIAYLKKREDGLYIAGLDSHTGFIYKKGTTMKFVHSSYYEAEKGVMAQELDSWNPLRDSRYRVIGRMLGDEMMKKWINGEGWE